jgi:hypothetical protein
LAAIAGVLLTTALTATTIVYAHTTQGILKESQRSRIAAETQATAAQNQASVAQSSLELLQRQIDNSARLGYSTMQTTISGALAGIEYWTSQDLPRLANMRGLPPTDALIPENAPAALDHARTIHGDSARRLSEAFENMRTARNEIEIMRELGREKIMGPAFYTPKCERIVQSLQIALQLLQKAQQGLLETKRSAAEPQ